MRCILRSKNTSVGFTRPPSLGQAAAAEEMAATLPHIRQTQPNLYTMIRFLGEQG